MNAKATKALGAEYRKQYGTLADNYGLTMAEMLVVMKAYQIYQNDIAANKDFASCGELLDYYDIGPGVFHDSGSKILISDLQATCPAFWEVTISGKVRISESAREYVETNIDLWQSAQELLAGVLRFRRG